MYNQQSTGEKSFLAAQVQRFQFDQRFSLTKQNRVLPALLQGGMEFTIARLVRAEVSALISLTNLIIHCKYLHMMYL